MSRGFKRVGRRKFFWSSSVRVHDFMELHRQQDWKMGEYGEWMASQPPVSDLMGRENHIFTVVPKAEVEADLDWRLPVFGAGRYLVAFDGAAPLFLELWRRGRQGHGRL